MSIGSHEIRALYTQETIRVYQAYPHDIAEEAVRLGMFGSKFKMDRMTWIKPSFLWMMYRCGWAEKVDQERVLAIDIKRSAFDYIVQNAIISTYSENMGITYPEWKDLIKRSEIRCQWDPERDPSGNPLEYRSIQLGLRGQAVYSYVNDWIVSLEDITDYVKDLNHKRKSGADISSLLPQEKVYVMDSTQNFSGLANDYTIGRPAYSNTFIEYLYSQYGFSEESAIADIGSGTGKFAKQLLDRGSFVYCVEPNDDMRKIAVEELGKYKNFRAVDGTAAETKLDEKSVDYITTAQAFHWFDVAPFKRECRRILRDNGMILLIWNIRDMSSEINQACFEIYSKYCPNFKGFGGGIQKNDIRIRQFFEDRYEYVEFDNPLFYDKNKFISRSLSGSYSLKNGDGNYSEYMDALSNVFEKYSKDNVLTMANKTAAYIGTMD